MKAFISWSGTRSHLVAKALHRWLPDVLNAVEPFVSSEDIDKGTRGLQVIDTELQSTAFGIICVTSENYQRPWVNFEAGALGKEAGSHVATILLDVAEADIEGPLTVFQHTRLELEDVQHLMRTINGLTEKPREPARVDEVTATLWPEFIGPLEERLAAVPAKHQPPQRSADDKLDELLTLVRDLARGSNPTPTDEHLAIISRLLRSISTRANDSRTEQQLLRNLYTHYAAAPPEEGHVSVEPARDYAQWLQGYLRSVTPEAHIHVTVADDEGDLVVYSHAPLSSAIRRRARAQAEHLEKTVRFVSDSEGDPDGQSLSGR